MRREERLKAAADNVCPFPGKCVDLERRLDKVEADTNSLKTVKSEMSASWQTLVSVGSALVAVGGLIAAFWSSKRP